MEIASCGMHRCNKSGVGTWGAFIGLIIQFIFIRAEFWQMLIVTIAAFIVGLIVTRPAEELMVKLYGPRKRHTGEIVIYDLNQDCWDEVVGQLVGGLLVSIFWADWRIRAVGYIVEFLFFRLFDIWKPWPIKKVEKSFRPGSAWGITLDDVVAGLYVWPVLGVMKFFI